MAVDILGLISSFTIFFSVYAILSLSLNLEYGVAGQPNFGKVLFYSIGCYTSGYISSVFLLYLTGHMVAIGSSEAIVLRGSIAESEPLINAVAFISSIAIAFIFGALAGYVASFPALKLKGDYLGITLLAAGEIFRIVIRGQESFSGGTQGIAGIPNPFIWISDVKLRYLSYALICLICAICIYLYMIKLVNSPYGRLLESIRDNEMASLSFGKKVSWIRGQVMMLGSGFAAIAGVLYSYYSGFVQADAFLPVVTFVVWVMVFMGGTANIKGSFLGALVISAIDLATRVVSFELQSKLGTMAFHIDYLRYIAYAILIILILMFKPSGLIPEKPIETPAWSAINEEKSVGGS